MVCSPHQYTLQKIAMPYMPAAAYMPQINYPQKPAYQVLPQQQLYTSPQTNIKNMFDYRVRQQYQPQLHYALPSTIENNESSKNAQPLFRVPTGNFTRMEQLPAAQPLASTGQDYGLPIYRAPGIVETKPQQKMKRDDLMQRIQLELAAMNEEKLPEDYQCAA